MGSIFVCRLHYHSEHLELARKHKINESDTKDNYNVTKDFCLKNAALLTYSSKNPEKMFHSFHIFNTVNNLKCFLRSKSAY